MDFSYPMSTAKVHIAFRTVEDHDVRCTCYKGAVHQVKLDNNYVFHVHEDTMLEVIHHMLKSNRKWVKNSRRMKTATGRGNNAKKTTLQGVS
jgi:hypothetical protein